MSLKEHSMQNPCDKCIHQSQSWNTDPCYKCGSENDYAWCEDEHGNYPNVVKGTVMQQETVKLIHAKWIIKEG